MEIKTTARSIRAAAIALAILCFYNVALHAVAETGANVWFAERGLAFWPPPSIYDYVATHAFWATYWLGGFALAVYLVVGAKRLQLGVTAKICAIALTLACLYDLVLHTFNLHGYISYQIVSRDAFWTIYWSLMTGLCALFMSSSRRISIDRELPRIGDQLAT